MQPVLLSLVPLAVRAGPVQPGRLRDPLAHRWHVDDRRGSPALGQTAAQGDQLGELLPGEGEPAGQLWVEVALQRDVQQ